jgi:hypothetical protein
MDFWSIGRWTDPGGQDLPRFHASPKLAHLDSGDELLAMRKRLAATAELCPWDLAPSEQANWVEAAAASAAWEARCENDHLPLRNVRLRPTVEEKLGRAQARAAWAENERQHRSTLAAEQTHLSMDTALRATQQRAAMDAQWDDVHIPGQGIFIPGPGSGNP